MELCDYLIKHGADIDHKEHMGRTALYWAASTGEAKILQFLIDHGCDVNVKTTMGRSALSKAAWNSSVDCLEILLKLPGVWNV